MTDRVTFHTNISSMVKKSKFVSLLPVIRENNVYFYLLQWLFYKIVETRFLISEMVFHRFIVNYTDFVHETSHVKPSKYDLTSGTKAPYVWKNRRGRGSGSEQALSTFKASDTRYLLLTGRKAISW